MVRGIDDVLVRLSRCCNPVPGDKIIGFVTRGRGVSVHREDCPNAVELKQHPERIIEVHWEDSVPDAIYNVEIIVEALDRMNLLIDVASVLSEYGANMLNCSSDNACETDGGNAFLVSRFLISVKLSASCQSFKRLRAFLMHAA